MYCIIIKRAIALQLWKCYVLVHVVSATYAGCCLMTKTFQKIVESTQKQIQMTVEMEEKHQASLEESNKHFTDAKYAGQRHIQELEKRQGSLKFHLCFFLVISKILVADWNTWYAKGNLCWVFLPVSLVIHYALWFKYYIIHVDSEVILMRFLHLYSSDHFVVLSLD